MIDGSVYFIPAVGPWASPRLPIGVESNFPRIVWKQPSVVGREPWSRAACLTHLTDAENSSGTVSKAAGISPRSLEQVSFLTTVGFLHEMETESCPCLSSSWASEELTEGTLYTEQLESRRTRLSENLDSYSLVIPS